MRIENHIFIAFGANLPLDGQAPEATVRAAMQVLAEIGMQPLAVSRIFATPCFPAGAGPDYVNGVLSLQADGRGAAEVLEALHLVEARFGRARTQRWAGRTLDLDLLAMGDLILPDATEQARWRHLPPDQQAKLAPDRLILPHPRLQDRAFVLVPLCDLAPGWRHPALGQTAAEMLAALPPEEVAAVKPL